MKVTKALKIMILPVVGLMLYFMFCATGCEPVQDIPEEQEDLDIYAEEPQGVLHHWCTDSAYMLIPEDVLTVYNSPNLEEVYHVDSIMINGTVVEVLISRIYSTSPDSPLCNTPRWDTLFQIYNEELKVRCKEVFAPFILAADTCQ